MSNFVQETQIEGNLSVISHPTKPLLYGNGSVQIYGTLNVDSINSKSVNSNVTLTSPLCFQTESAEPSVPQSGNAVLYSDASYSGRLLMLNSAGQIIDLNPLQTPGDIMTFDGNKNTTVRMGSGRPLQNLQCDRQSSTGTGLVWKSDQANVGNVCGTSDTYMRYCEVQSSVQSVLTQIPQQLNFDTSKRMDLDTFSLSNSTNDCTGITINAVGIYEITFSTSVSFQNNPLGIPPGTDVNVQTYIETSGQTGYSKIPGANFYANFPFNEKSSFSSRTTLSCRIFLDVSSVTYLRFFAQENSTTGALMVNPFDASVSIIKLAFLPNNGQEFLAVNGVIGSRPIITENYSVISMAETMYSSNQDDNVSASAITLSDGGYRNIFVKLSFTTVNVTLSQSAVICSQLLINGTVYQQAYSTILSNDSSTSTNINALYLFSAGDQVSVQSKIVTGGVTTGEIVAVSEDCCVYATLPGSNNVFDKFYSYSTASYLPGQTSYTYFNPDTQVIIDNESYCVYGSLIQTLGGGTFQYVIGATIANDDASETHSGMLLLTTQGETGKEISSSVISYNVGPLCTQTLSTTGTLFMPPRSNLMFEMFAPDGSVTIDANSAYLQINKYENTNALFNNLSDFGRFPLYVFDAENVISTSTTYALRLAAITMNVPGGLYRVGLSFEWDMNNAGVGFATQTVLDGSLVIDSYETVPLMTGVFNKVTSFSQVQLTVGSHTIAFNTKVSNASRSLCTQNVRIEMWRISS